MRVVAKEDDEQEVEGGEARGEERGRTIATR